MDTPSQCDSLHSVLEAVRRGELVLILDDVERENEGDLMVAASLVTPELMAFLVQHSSGFVCAAVHGSILDRLNIPLMLPGHENQDAFRTAYTQTFDYKLGTTTGISAHDRALTAFKLSQPDSAPEDFIRPGHLVGLRAKPGGVLTRRGHTEAGVDLCRLAGLPEVSVICELVKPGCPSGSMAKRADCFEFSKLHRLKIIAIDQIVQFRLAQAQSPLHHQQ